MQVNQNSYIGCFSHFPLQHYVRNSQEHITGDLNGPFPHQTWASSQCKGWSESRFASVMAVWDQWFFQCFHSGSNLSERYPSIFLNRDLSAMSLMMFGMNNSLLVGSALSAKMTLRAPNLYPWIPMKSSLIVWCFWCVGDHTQGLTHKCKVKFCSIKLLWLS